MRPVTLFTEYISTARDAYFTDIDDVLIMFEEAQEDLERGLQALNDCALSPGAEAELDLELLVEAGAGKNWDSAH